MPASVKWEGMDQPAAASMGNDLPDLVAAMADGFMALPSSQERPADTQVDSADADSPPATQVCSEAP